MNKQNKETKTIKTIEANGQTFTLEQTTEDLGVDYEKEHGVRFFTDEINTRVIEGKKQIGTMEPCTGTHEGFFMLNIFDHFSVVLNDLDHVVEKIEEFAEEGNTSIAFEVWVTFWNTGKREEFIYDFSHEEIKIDQRHDYSNTETTDRAEAEAVAELLRKDPDVSGVEIVENVKPDQYFV